MSRYATTTRSRNYLHQDKLQTFEKKIYILFIVFNLQYLNTFKIYELHDIQRMLIELFRL